MNDQASQSTVLGPDTHIKGEMFFSGSAQILGTFEGRITSKGEVLVGRSATCKASVEAARVVVDGTIEGDVLAHERAELSPSAKVCGDLTARSLVVSEGASFTGHFRVGSDIDTEAKPSDASAGTAAAAGIEVRPVRAATTIEARLPADSRPARVARNGEMNSRADRIARAAAEIEADTQWQQVAGV